MFDGRCNRLLAWGLLLLGFAGAIGLDPWSLSERDPSVLVGSPRMLTRHAQAVVVGIAFLQLIVSRILAMIALPAAVRGGASLFSALGAVGYVTGYVLLVGWPESAWLVAASALINLCVFLVLAAACWGQSGHLEVKVVLTVFCLGMLIDFLMGLHATDPERFLSGYLGPEDGLRLRMLRLARAAAIALSSLALLSHELADRAGSEDWLCRWGVWLLVVGAAGMPLILAVAAFTSTDVKYLLGLPAQATLWGTLAAACLARRWARPLELWGWLLIALSMVVGLLMGMYAFEGPMPAPAFLGAYNDFPRRLCRLAHAYCIVFGLLSIFLAREQDEGSHQGGPARVGVLALATGSVLTLLLLALLASFPLLPVEVLSVGPATIVVGLILCLVPQRAT